MPQKDAPTAETLQIFESVPDLYLILSPELYILTASDAYLAATLTERHRIAGRHLLEVFPENLKAPGANSVIELRASLQQVLHTRKPHQMALQRYDVPRQEPGDGLETYWLPLNTPVLDEQGEVHYIIHKVSDVTGQVRDKQQIQQLKNREQTAEGERQLRLITDALPVLIAYIDKEERYRFANKAYEEWFPLKAEDLIGRSVREVVGEEAYRQIAGYMERGLAGERLDFTASMPYREGFTRHIQVSYIPDVQEGEMAGFYSLVNDITAQTEARQQLEESEEKYRSLFETMEQGFCIMEMIFDDRNTPVDYRFIETNPTFERQTGLKDARGKTARQLVPKLEAHWFEIYGKVALTGEPARLTQGSEAMGRWFEIYAFRLGGSESRKVALLFSDVTRRKQVEESLKRTNLWFQRVNQATQDAIWDWDLTTQYITWNEGVYRMFNYTPEEVRADASWWIEHVHPSDREQVEKSIHQVIDSGKEHWAAEYRFLTGDGGYKIVFDRGFVIHDEQGRAERMIGSMQDISERKRVEEALKESEARLRATVETTPDCIKIVDHQGALLFMNKAGLRMVETESSDSVKGTSVYDLIAPEHRADWKEMHRRVCWGESLSWEYEIIGRQGTRRWMESHAVPLENPDGSVAHLSVGRDITERKTAEKALKESRERFARVIEGSNDGIWEWDFRNDRAWWNPRFDAIIGVKIPERKRSLQALNQYIHPDDKKLIPDVLQAHLQRGEKYQVEFRFVRPSGEVRNILTKGKAVLDKQGEPIMISGTITDFTERRQAEETLKLRNEQLTRINNDLDNFIYTASHDLKAPILNIEGLVNLLNKSFRADLQHNEKIEALMGMIHTSIGRFKGTIKDLTEVAKVQSYAEEEVDELSFEALLEEVKLNIKSLYDESGARIQTDFSKVPAMYYSKKNLRSIMYNLVSNAMKYRSPDRPLNIAIATSRPDKDHIVLSVEDNGLGIKEKDQAKVFMMFKRLHQHVEGTGIGMAIVKKIIDNSGGKIELESREGKGSLFKIYFKV